MAYINQERKKALAPAINKLLKSHGLKGSLSIQNYSTLVLTIHSGNIDFAGGRDDFDGQCINPFYLHDHFDGEVLDLMKKLRDAMNVGNYDKSDSQTDYFDVGWYIRMQIGKWNKPYVLTA